MKPGLQLQLPSTLLHFSVFDVLQLQVLAQLGPQLVAPHSGEGGGEDKNKKCTVMSDLYEQSSKFMILHKIKI